MKRYVYVPFDLIINQEIPDFAHQLARLSKLPIRLGLLDEFPDQKNIEIICIPEKNNILFDKVVEKNYIQYIEYTNEFEKINKKTKCLVTKDNKEYIFYPYIAEKHCLKYQFRIDELGQFCFKIVNDVGQILSDEYHFEVI